MAHDFSQHLILAKLSENKVYKITHSSSVLLEGERGWEVKNHQDKTSNFHNFF